jgi:hypothetical protein
VGRTDEIGRLRELLFTPSSRRIASILGLGGIGKSRLALELAFQEKAENPHHSVFWIEASKHLSFERDVLEIGKKLRIPGIGDDKADIKNLFKQRLCNPSTEKWLLIVDNADDEALCWGDLSTLHSVTPLFRGRGLASTTLARRPMRLAAVSTATTGSYSTFRVKTTSLLCRVHLSNGVASRELPGKYKLWS